MKSTSHKEQSQPGLASMAPNCPSNKTTPNRKKPTGKRLAAKAARKEKPPMPEDRIAPAPPGLSAPAPDGIEGSGNTAVDGDVTSVEAAAVVIDRELLSLKGRAADDMVEPVRMFWTRGGQATGQAVQLETLARLFRWATGRALLMVKESLDHGDFGNWLERHRGALGFGARTAGNYMNLARDYPDTDSFLKAQAPLRDLYGRPDPDEEDEEDPVAGKKEVAPGSRRPSRAEALMASLTTLQKRLRHVTESDEQLAEDQLVQLKLVKAEIDRFLDTLLNQPRAHQ